ncbi:MAG: hypothetical protein QM736_02520 [Vicinamibacterales bacterium]
MNYLLSFIRGDEQTMARMLAASVGVGQTNAAYGWQAHVLASQGKLAAAHEQFQLGIRMAQQNGFQEVAGQLSIEDAEAHAVVGACADVRNEIAEGLALTRDNYSLERGSRTLILCGHVADAEQLLRELRNRYPNATLTTRVSLPVAEATEALERRDARRAIETLEQVEPYDRASRSAFWPEYLRGLAFLQLADGQNAIEQFKGVLDHRGEDPTSSIYPLARLGLARAYAVAGDTGNARQTYEEFLAAWSQADQTLKPITAARQELARLR